MCTETTGRPRPAQHSLAAYCRSFKRKLTSPDPKFSNGWLTDSDLCFAWAETKPATVVRCRERRRADLHSSPNQRPQDHLVKTKTPTCGYAIVPGYLGWYRDPKYQDPATTVQPHPNAVPIEALTDQYAIDRTACTR
jgi:hypothetical protein